MSMFRKLFPLAMMVAVLAICSVEADAATLSRTGPSTRVCQVIGENDWISGQPTAAKTLSAKVLARM